MKISKLFHWLYGILMLLPILVFLPNAFYYGFNEQAIAQEKTEHVPVYYESNEINDISDFYVGNIYFWDDNYTSGYSGNNTNVFYIDNDLFKNQFVNYSTYNVRSVYFQIRSNNALRLIVTYLNSSNTEVVASEDIVNKTFNFIPTTINDSNLVSNYLLNDIKKSDYLFVKEYQALTYSMSITDSMSYAWDSVWQNDLFSWSYESFLAEPFKYIGNVFGLPNDNSIYYCLSYWLDISIIWLCFDLIMYVPLLVHRWIDKGVLE